jgi:glucose/arabinose dehydrogenase
MRKIFLPLLSGLVLMACNNNSSTVDKASADSSAKSQETVMNNQVQLPAPYATKSVQNMSKVVGWSEGKMPVAPTGFTVTKFADSLESPRWIYVANNGDIFVAQADREGKKGNNIILFRDKNKDGVPESKSVYVSKLKQPFGMLILNNKFYVGNTDALLEFSYDPAATSISSKGKAIASFPTGRHWTRNIISNAGGDKIYIAVGSGSNVAENGIDKENRRANILVINTDGTGEKVYASGLRNPVGMDWAPGTSVLWTAVNERDELGDDLVPDYIAGVREGGFYGWPYSYFGQHEDPRIKDEDKRPELVTNAIVPDVALGSHTSSLGLLFYRGTAFPSAYHGGAFVTQHGSWNRSHLSGYKVVFVPFSGGKPSGEPQDFLTGFIANEEKSEVYGRPVGITMLENGSLLLADDGAGKIWKISYVK